MTGSLSASSARPGPKPSADRRQSREIFHAVSERTFCTFWRADCLLRDMYDAGGPDVLAEVMGLAERPNGTLNMSKFARISRERYRSWTISTRPRPSAAELLARLAGDER